MIVLLMSAAHHAVHAIQARLPRRQIQPSGLHLRLRLVRRRGGRRHRQIAFGGTKARILSLRTTSRG